MTAACHSIFVKGIPILYSFIYFIKYFQRCLLWQVYFSTNNMLLPQDMKLLYLQKYKNVYLMDSLKNDFYKIFILCTYLKKKYLGRLIFFPFFYSWDLILPLWSMEYFATPKKCVVSPPGCLGIRNVNGACWPLLIAASWLSR